MDGLKSKICMLSTVIQQLTTTSSSLHTLSPVELYASQRKWASLLDYADGVLEDVQKLTASASPELNEPFPMKSDFCTDDPYVTHLNWIFENISSLASTVRSKRCLVLLKRGGQLIPLTQYAMEGDQTRVHDRDILDLCDCVFRSGLMTNVYQKNSPLHKDNASPSFIRGLAVPLFVEEDCVGVLGLFDNLKSPRFGSFEEGAAVLMSSIIGEYISRKRILSALAGLGREDYPQVSPALNSRKHLVLRVNHQMPHWARKREPSMGSRHALAIGSSLLDVHSKLDTLEKDQNTLKNELQRSSEREHELKRTNEQLIAALDSMRKESALLKFSNQRLLEGNFLQRSPQVHDPSLGDDTKGFSPQSPKWNGNARFVRVRR